MAVYTEVDDAQLNAFFEQYDVGQVRAFKGIAEGVENTNYFVETDKSKFILTLFEKRVAEGDLPYFMDLMGHLSRKKIPVPLPVAQKNGEVLNTLCGKSAALIKFLPGLSVRKPNLTQCKQVGEMLAKMHLALSDFTQLRDNSMDISHWRELLDGIGEAGRRLPVNVLPYAMEMLLRVEKEWPKQLPKGTIHGDLFPNNVLFHKDRISGLIDFYFSATDFLAFDLAILLNAWCFESDSSYNLTKGQVLLQAYDKVRPLVAQERDAFPTLCRGAALRFLVTRMVDFVHVPTGALVKPHDPVEYYKKLQFHADIVSPRAYGLN